MSHQIINIQPLCDPDEDNLKRIDGIFNYFKKNLLIMCKTFLKLFHSSGFKGLKYCFAFVVISIFIFILTIS